MKRELGLNVSGDYYMVNLGRTRLKLQHLAAEKRRPKSGGRKAAAAAKVPRRRRSFPSSSSSSSSSPPNPAFDDPSSVATGLPLRHGAFVDVAVCVVWPLLS